MQHQTAPPTISKLKCSAPIFSAVVLLASILPSYGIITDLKQIRIDFTDLTDATNKASWAGSLSVSKDGLGLDGEPSQVRDGWIQTKPLALGPSWRPPSAISVRVVIEPAPHEITLGNGQKTTPDSGDVYLRYSPDRQHWSSWQVLQRATPQRAEETKKPARYYSATVRVPARDRADYGRLLCEYSTLDVPWKSDEEAAVRWILAHDPDFFARQIPFIGYVELLFEDSFHGGQRLSSFQAEIPYAVGGLHSIARDLNVYTNREGPWRFETKQRM